MEPGHPGEPRARMLYDVLALLSRPRYNQWQDNKQPRGSSRREEQLLGDVAIHSVGVPVCLSGLLSHYRRLEPHIARSWKFLFYPAQRRTL